MRPKTPKRIRPRQSAPASGNSRASRVGARIRRATPWVVAQEALGICLWIWDAAQDEVRWFGDPAVLLGLAPGSFPGRFRDFLECVHPDDRAQARAEYLEHLHRRKTAFRHENRVLWPDGTQHWIETHGRARYGRDGRATELCGLLRDCTEGKLQQSALARTEDLLGKAFRASPDYMMIADLSEGRALAVNPAFEQITGYSAERAIGRSVAELGAWEQPAERARWTALLRERGELRDWPVQLRHADGHSITVELSSALIDLDGRAGVITIGRDVTAQRHGGRVDAQGEPGRGALFRFTLPAAPETGAPA